MHSDSPVEWRPVEGWPYEVSNLGQVRRTGAACGTRPGKILRAAKHGAGRYLTVALFRKQEQRRVAVHVLVCTAFHGERPTPKHCACHNDGDETNNRSDNLRWDTKKGNADDRTRHGTENVGHRNPMAKLTADDVIAIRSAAAVGADRHALARKYGLHKNSLDQIIRRATWRHI